MAKKAFNGRAFVSLLSTVGFLVLVVTGIIMWMQPHGRVAYWTIWRFWGITKDQWTDVHIIGGLLFLVSGIFHLYYNWRPLMNYLSGKAQSQLKHKTELGLSALVLVLVVASGIWSLPPLNYVVEWGSAIKETWVIAPEYEPPFGHAEAISLHSFTRKQGIDLKAAKETLAKANLKVENDKETLEEIALANQTTPMHIYMAIKSLEPKFEAPAQGTKWTIELVEQKFAGKGLGRLTLQGVCELTGLKLEQAMAKLKNLNIDMKPEDKFKATADANKINPMDLLKKLLIDQS